MKSDEGVIEVFSGWCCGSGGPSQIPEILLHCSEELYIIIIMLPFRLLCRRNLTTIHKRMGDLLPAETDRVLWSGGGSLHTTTTTTISKCIL